MRSVYFFTVWRLLCIIVLSVFWWDSIISYSSPSVSQSIEAEDTDNFMVFSYYISYPVLVSWIWGYIHSYRRSANVAFDCDWYCDAACAQKQTSGKKFIPWSNNDACPQKNVHKAWNAQLSLRCGRNRRICISLFCDTRGKLPTGGIAIVKSPIKCSLQVEKRLLVPCSVTVERKSAFIFYVFVAVLQASERRC